MHGQSYLQNLKIGTKTYNENKVEEASSFLSSCLISQNFFIYIRVCVDPIVYMIVHACPLLTIIIKCSCGYVSSWYSMLILTMNKYKT